VLHESPGHGVNHCPDFGLGAAGKILRYVYINKSLYCLGPSKVVKIRMLYLMARFLVMLGVKESKFFLSFIG